MSTPRRRRRGPIDLAIGCLLLSLLTVETARGQRRPARQPASRSTARAEAADKDAIVADRIALRGGGELLGLIVEPTAAGSLTVLARREWLQAHLADRLEAWDDAGRAASVAARDQRRRRLEAWRRERPTVPAPGDRITAWLDRELAEESGPGEATLLMAISIARAEATTVQRRGTPAARALRQAWLMGLPEPESTPYATLSDQVAGRGTPDADDPVAVDRLLPPAAESEDRWLLRRAATEALYDDGLRLVRFGGTVLPEPGPGRPPDPALGATLVHGTIRDVLGGGGADPLPERLRAVADRGRVGVMVTRIEIAADFGSASAESTLYHRGPQGWGRGVWRSASVRVGEVPPFVAGLVARDPQVKAILDLVDTIGAGLVTPEMKRDGLAVGTAAGGAAVAARASLIQALGDIAPDLDEGRAASPSPVRR